jgi:hypothetical protein
MAAPPNPFLPPDLGGPDAPAPLELSDVPKVRAPAPAIDTAPVVPPPRAPANYKNPDAAGRTFLVLVLAAAGLGVVFAGFKLLRKNEPKTPQVAAQPAPAPVVWRSVAKGDTVLITVQVEPRSARHAKLLLDGAPLPSNPVSLPRGSEHKIAALADDHEPAVVAFTADEPRSVKLTLRRTGR